METPGLGNFGLGDSKGLEKPPGYKSCKACNGFRRLRRRRLEAITRTASGLGRPLALNNVGGIYQAEGRQILTFLSAAAL